MTASIKKNKYEIDMCSGNLFLKIIKFSVPLAIMGMLQLFYNAADLLVVSAFANQEGAVGAIGSTNSLISLLINFFMGLSIGTSIICGKLYGAKETDKVSSVVHTSILTSLIIGFVMGIVGFVFADPLLSMMNNEQELSRVYLKIYFIGLPFNILYNFAASILRSVGDTKRPLIFLTIAGITNVILNFILVYFFHLGVAGVAIATITSQIISCCLIMRTLILTNEPYKITISKLKIHKQEMFQIIKLGLPAGIQSMLFSISNVIIQSSVNSFQLVTGSTIVTDGNAAAASIEGFIFVAMNSVYQASLAFTSQNYGAKNAKNIIKVTIYSLIIVTSISLFLSGTFFLFAKQLLSMYVDGEAIEIGYIRMHYLCLPYFLYGIMDVIVGVLRGLSLSTLPMIVSVLGICGFRVLWIYTVFMPNTNFTNYNDLNLLYVSYPISWILTFIVQLVILFIVSKKIFKSFKTTNA